jgi:hypothetical protein
MTGNLTKWLKRVSAATLPAAALFLVSGAVTPADANDGWRRGHNHHHGHHRHWSGPRVIVQPAPVYVAPRYYYPPPPPVYYAPPPVYYAPPPVYYAPRYPSAHLSIGIPLR